MLLVLLDVPQMLFALLVIAVAATGDSSMPKLESPFVKEIFAPMQIVDPNLCSPIIPAVMEPLLALENARDKPTELADGPFDLVRASNSI
jgi:hypothetical protein